jgi:hypothetical protein
MPLNFMVMAPVLAPPDALPGATVRTLKERVVESNQHRGTAGIFCSVNHVASHAADG